MSTTANSRALQNHSREQLVDEVHGLRGEVDVLKRELQWFKRQLFGSKSEARPVAQLGLLAGASVADVSAATPDQTPPTSRGKALKQRPDDCVPIAACALVPMFCCTR